MNQAVNKFFQRVYGMMFLGLLLSGLSAFFVVKSEMLQSIILGNTFVFFGLIILELALVIILSFSLMKMSPDVAAMMFLIYSFVNGLTLSSIFFVYTTGSIVLSFFIAAVLFLSMAIYGFVLKKDISGWGGVLFGALISLIVLMIINLFIRSSAFDFFISVFAIILFSGLTIYDNNVLKKFAREIRDKTTLARVSVLGALRLYLDFINLFLAILRIMGRRR
jgi:FtsH-binding integral membrane protein